MKKTLIVGLVVILGLGLANISFAGGRHYSGHRGGHNNNAGAILAGGLILGAGILIGSAIASQPSPPSYPPSYPSPSPQPHEYSQPAFPWQGVRVSLSDRGGWGNDASVRGIIVDVFRSWGAEMIVVSGSGYRRDVDAPYVLEIQTRSEGNRAMVEIWLIERATGAIRLHGLGDAAFYYDGSDRWRSFQWATQRALSNLR